jgi:hypothetical protein
MDVVRSHDPDEEEFVSVPLAEQLDADPVGPSDANALEGGDDLHLIEKAAEQLR